MIKDKKTIGVDIAVGETKLLLTGKDGQMLEAVKDTDKYTIFKDPREGGCLCIQCKECGKISYNGNDVNQKYCGNCKEFHRFIKSELEMKNYKPINLEEIKNARK